MEHSMNPVTQPSRISGAVVAAAVLSVSGFTIGCSGPSRPAENTRPVIILDIDTLRADHLGCYGYHRDTSPNIDRMAAEAVRFDWTLSQAPNTPPSQTSILTSLYPSTHGMFGKDDRVPDEVTTLAESMSAAGYTTAAFVDGGWMSPHWNIDQGFELYDSGPSRGLAKIGPKAIRWVRRHADENFLLLIHTYDVHSGYEPPDEYRDLFLDGLKKPTKGFEPTSDKMKAIHRRARKGKLNTLPKRDIEYAKALYDAEIRYVDDWIGKFMGVLDELGLLDNAVVILLSDHGEEFQEHGWVLHSQLYTTVTRIPLIIRPPGGTEGRTVSDLVESIDIMLTILEMTGVPFPESPIHGRSLVGLMEGAQRDPATAYGEFPPFGGTRHHADPVYHLVTLDGPGTAALYDYRNDPLELEDLSEANPEVVERMRHTLDNWSSALAAMDRLDEVAPGELDPEVEEQLRALGYLD
jgi:arylsulfatase A-like enzyme